MIAATDISIDGDTAWWVKSFARQDGLTDPESAWMFDRPCDNEFAHDDTWDCPDCDGTGRHTFDIEVAKSADPVVAKIVAQKYGRSTYRVSVVEVLPIQATDDGGRLIHWDVDSEEFWLFESASHDLADLVVLPESAAPGMYAVKLKVAT